MKATIERLVRNLKLLFQRPKDFLYSFKYSKKKFIEIYPFDPNSLTHAKELIQKLKKECPFLNLYLIGSVGLGIDGLGDIDLYAAAPKNKFSLAEKIISRQFGKPLKMRNDFVEWNFKYNGTDVELKLTDPHDKQFVRQIKLFNLLKKKKILNEYKKLKTDLGNSSEREYVRRKMEFFEKLLASSK